MACTTCGQKRRGVGAQRAPDAPARRTREIVTGAAVMVEISSAILPVNVLLPMRLLAYQAGRKLLIYLPTTELPRPIAEWLVGRFPGHVVMVVETQDIASVPTQDIAPVPTPVETPVSTQTETPVETQNIASVLSVPTKKKKASKPR